MNHRAFLLAAILPATGLCGQQFGSQEAVAAARSNAKPGSSVTVLWEVVANADTRRIAYQALEQAQAHKIEFYENGILVNILRSGGYLLAETNRRTNNMVAMHLVLMEAGGAVKDVQQECHGVVKLADAEELVKDTAELVKQMYSTPSTEESALASRFYGGNFPESDQHPDCVLRSLISCEGRALTQTRSEKHQRSFGGMPSGRSVMHFPCPLLPLVQLRRKPQLRRSGIR